MNDQLPRLKLKALRVRAGWTVRAFAEAMGFGDKQSSYRTYEDTFKKPYLPIDLIERAAPLLIDRGSPPIEAREIWVLAGVVPGELGIGQSCEPAQTTKPMLHRSSETITIREIDISPQTGGDASIGGISNNAIEQISLASWSMPRSFIENYVSDTSGLAIIRVTGNSMEPDFFPNERVLVDTAHRTLSQDGIYWLWNGHGAVIKKLQLIPNSKPERVRIISINPTYPSDEVDLAEIKVEGRIVGKWVWK